ncbi:MAG: spore maturation protein A [Ruminococcaceae bacterium]|nr:spore maturation protein A [Oscillospiraceae bacterium]
MAMAWVWTGMVVLSCVFGLTTGSMDAVGTAAIEGAAAAVELCLSMAGLLCLWSGVMEVMTRCGLADRLARLFHPLLRRIFPRACRDPETLSALSANVSANLLGLGNAATPLGIRAARRMARGAEGVATDELCRLVVLNTASIQLLPTTVAGLRSALGASAPFDILPAVWLSSLLSVTAGLTMAKLLSLIGRDRA